MAMARGREASAGRRRLLAAAALAGALVAGAPRAARACTALGVGKAASATGGESLPLLSFPPLDRTFHGP